MPLRSWLKIAVMIAVVVLLLPNANPAHATTAAIGQFFAGCGNFSVDVAVSGQNNDGNNVDRFRYYVVDGNNKTLYQEDATRPVGTTAGSLVINLAYMFAPPVQNPITFAVVELDGNGNAGGWVAAESYMAPCLPVNGSASRSGIFSPPKIVIGTILGDTPLYQGPGSGQLNLVARAGATHQVIYRTPDSAWVAIFVGGNDLVWIPAGAISTYLPQVALQPTTIDGNNPATPGGPVGAAAAPAPTGQSATILTNLRMHSAPNADPTNVVNVIPSGTVVPVLGTSADRAFVQVSYNGTTGWVSARFVRLGAGAASSGAASSGGTTTTAPATGVTGVTLADLRLHSTPVLNLTNVVSTVPFGTVVPVLGRSADNQLVKVSYNGMDGWVAAGFVRLVGSSLAALPVVP